MCKKQTIKGKIYIMLLEQSIRQELYGFILTSLGLHPKVETTSPNRLRTQTIEKDLCMYLTSLSYRSRVRRPHEGEAKTSHTLGENVCDSYLINE